MKLIAILLSFILSVFLLTALADNPYSYYQFMRVVTLLFTCFIIYTIYKHDNGSKYIWYFIAVALLFNPLIPIYLDKSAWAIFDVLVAVSAPIITIFALKVKKA